MTTLYSAADILRPTYGRVASKSTGTLAATTVALFTVAGGKVIVTSLHGEVTTSITVANSYKLQHNPTVGTTSDLFAATDIGSTDSPLGNYIGCSGTFGDICVSRPGVSSLPTRPICLAPGQIESVSAGTDGVILWTVTWIALDEGATLVAA